MRLIKQGTRGEDVQAFQQFLRGGQCDAAGECTVSSVADAVVADGIFGPATAKATKAWQTGRGLVADGVVGPGTWAAAVQEGFPVDAVPTTEQVDADVPPDPADLVDETSAAWPPRPAGVKPLVSNDARNDVFGVIEYIASPTKTNPERVVITNDWARKNIVKVNIPELSDKPISMHRLAAPQFKAWLAAATRKGLAGRIISYAGCWVPRYVRGSRTRLSCHSWATAIDVNVSWNRRGRRGALLGQKGCVRELAAFCADFGVFTGLWYKGAPEDSMHFEIFRVLTAEELAAAIAKHSV